jgi:sec-independent protein translocase protein TatC
MIRKILHSIRQIITLPFRLIAKPYHAYRNFLEYEPEDTPLGDAFSRAVEQPTALLEHLEALRGHLIRSIIVLVIMVLVSMSFAGYILDWLAKPIGGIDNLQSIEVTESIGAFMRVSLLTGFALAMPYISAEIFAYVNPGLKPGERKALLAITPFATLLFLAGLAFSYYVMLPAALPFMMGFIGINTVPRPSSYIRFVTGVMFWIGIAFQFPLAIYSMARLGFVSAKTLANGWRVAVLAIAILAAVVTPTIDPVNMAIVMLPMILLYFISIAAAAIAERRHDSSAAKS